MLVYHATPLPEPKFDMQFVEHHPWTPFRAFTRCRTLIVRAVAVTLTLTVTLALLLIATPLLLLIAALLTYKHFRHMLFRGFRTCNIISYKLAKYEIYDLQFTIVVRVYLAFNGVTVLSELHS